MIPSPITGTTDVTTQTYADEIVRGGFPRLRLVPDRFRATAWEGYLTEIFDRDLPELGRLVTASKHHLTDPAIACHLLGLNSNTLLATPAPSRVPIPRAGALFCALFESLVTLSVRVYADIAGVRVSHLRTRNGDHEVDIMLTRPDGKSVAIEVKSTADIDFRDTRHLSWLQQQMGGSPRCCDHQHRSRCL